MKAKGKKAFKRNFSKNENTDSYYRFFINKQLQTRLSPIKK